MFLKILGDDDCPREYWPFVLRMETVLYGILAGGAPRIAQLGEEELICYLFEALGAAMDTRHGEAAGKKHVDNMSEQCRGNDDWEIRYRVWMDVSCLF